ncbi:HYR domain-containing protein [Salegentibacter sp. LM13S]|uniref:LamG-like jellyroll fold domain-containing protein n=1 Tax=Salegentibacter lacus TaxID=2873599 RepID=UPI001CCA5307|nr:LamG-like jellyroll fold domain-containing protein [Salegentibacter lacus]MBZ9632551.1 HYR domain-containing protein [Salegentibacter lacus]
MKHNYFLKFLVLIFISFAFGKAMGQTPIFSPGMNISVTGGVSSPSGEDVSKIIDGNNNTKFLDFNYSDGMGFTVYMGGTPYIAASIEITTANDSPNRDPQNFQISGSNDGSAFTSVASGSIPCISSRFTKRSFSFSNTNAYKYYKIIFTTQCGLDNSLQVAETQLLEAKVNQTPVAVCKDITAQLDGSGNVTISPNDVDGGSSDSEGEVTLSLDKNSFNCEDIGQNTVTLTVTDSDGAIDTCTATVTVEDNIAPTIICQTNIEVDNDAGTDGAIVNYSLPLVSDECTPENNITNGSFEQGDYSGWTITSSNPNCGSFLIGEDGETFTTGLHFDYADNKDENQSSPNLPFNIAATDGQFMAVFLQNCSSTHRMYQDINVDQNSVLKLDLGYNNTIGFDANNQYIAIAIKDVNTDDTIEELFKTEAGDALSIPVSAFSFDLSAYANQAIRLEVIQATINSSYFDVFLDNIRIEGLQTIQTAGLPTGSEFPIGTTTNTFEVTDASGNKSTCSFHVIVNDMEAPTGYSVSIDQAEIDENNQTGVSFTFAGAEVGSTYNYTFSSDNGGTNVTGSGTITAAIDQVTGIDLSGLEDGTITLSVTLTDTALNEGAAVTDTKLKATNQAPVAVCKAFTAQLDTSGNVIISPNDVNSGSSDDKAGFILSIDKETFDCSNIGENTVELTITDSDGVKDTCAATVTVEDNTAPTAIAKDITVQLDENGMAFITPEMIDSGSSDNCTNPDALSFSLDKTEFSCENVESNNPSAIDFISENNSYFSTDAPANIPVGTQERTISLWVNPDVSDFCWGCLVQQGNGDCTSKMFGLGMSENNKLVFWGGCDDYISNLDIPNDTWTYIAVTFKNGLVTLYANGESESFSKPNINTTSSKLFVGRETVNNGASFRDNFDGQIDEVRIYDKALNELEVEEDKASQTPLNGVISSYTFDDKNGTDINDEEGNNNGTLLGSNGENFVEGISKQAQVTLTVTDQNGNSATATAIVTVEDNIAAEVLTQDITVQLDELGMASITPEMIDNGSNDACGIESLGLDVADFTCENIGENTVTLTATDVNGNESSATAVVTVEDNIAAEVLTQNITVQLDELGMASITPEMIDNGSNDTCGIESIGLDITDFTCENIGENTVTLTATDVNGNESSATATVMVEDNVAPIVETQPITVQLDANGVASITPEDIDNGSSDNCEIDTMSLDITEFSCVDVDNPVTVTLTVIDVNGNESSATAIVTVEDNIPAEVLTQNITVQLDETGMASITPEMIDNESNDACGIESLILDITDFTCENIGENTVTLTATDVNGNESSATATVTVEDTIAPIPDDAELEDIVVKCEVVTGRITAPTATDNCSVLTATTLDPLTYDQPGSYTITWNFDDGNGNTAMQTQTVIVEPSPLNAVTFDDASFVYNGSEHSLKVDNLPEGASVDYTISSETGTQNAAINAGVYTVTANLSSGSERCPATELTALLTIQKAQAEITAEATQIFTYDGNVKNVTASLNHSETELSYSPQEGFTEPGTYEITLTSAETENYLATTKEVSLVIEKAEITGVVFEDDTFTYDGSEHSIYVSGLPEEASVSYENNGKTNAGNKMVTATISQENYNDLVLTAQLEVKKAEQAISFDEIEDRNQLAEDNFQLEATASSGLPVIYSYTYESENPAATVGPRGFVRILGAGQVVITATQEGNQNYESAAAVVRTLTINGSEARLNTAVINGVTYSNPTEDIYYLIGCGNSENEVQIQLEQNQGSTIDRDNSFTMTTPTPGIYKETVIVTSEDGNSTRTYNITVEKNFNFEDIVIQKFNNVLLVNNNPDTNGGYKFVSYRWYKDGSVIGKGQYYSVGNNADDQLDANSSYYVVLETEEGEFLRTCTSAIQLRSSLNVALAPNPVSSGGTMELLADFPKEELETMQLSIHNLNGMLIKQMKSNNKSTSITLPYNLQMGVYLLKIETENISKSLKFIIK